MAQPTTVDHDSAPAVTSARLNRFGRYAAISLVTVPVGYTLVVLARHTWNINAGVLNLLVGTALTPPSYWMYRTFVWPEPPNSSVLRALFTFWQTVLAGALASSLFIALADWWWPRNALVIVSAGLLGQGSAFIGRFLWLDVVKWQTSDR